MADTIIYSFDEMIKKSLDLKYVAHGITSSNLMPGTPPLIPIIEELSKISELMRKANSNIKASGNFTKDQDQLIIMDFLKRFVREHNDMLDVLKFKAEEGITNLFLVGRVIVGGLRQEETAMEDLAHSLMERMSSKQKDIDDEKTKLCGALQKVIGLYSRMYLVPHADSVTVI
ncbi:hypothetical protein F4808DRAFT_463806 [Astrocystis sublimbata]|nr:hypothetical protein F4808DRAFT_463806 [Astrocystis sublimbata]